MTRIKMGSDESRFNVSLIVRDKVTRTCPQTTTFEEKGESKRYRTEVLPLTSLPPYRQAKPALPLASVIGFVVVFPFRVRDDRDVVRQGYYHHHHYHHHHHHHRYLERLILTDPKRLHSLYMHICFQDLMRARTHAHARTRARTHARTHAHTHTHTHTHWYFRAMGLKGGKNSF